MLVLDSFLMLGGLEFYKTASNWSLLYVFRGMCVGGPLRALAQLSVR